LKQYMDR